MAESKELGEFLTPGPGMTDGVDEAAASGKERLPLNRVVACDPVEPRDPMAYPTYKRRVEGAARPIYQLGEEPMRLQEDSGEARVVSPKMELDITTFLKAVHAAFPHPRDPLVRPVLKARPVKAARPMLFVAGRGSDLRTEEDLAAAGAEDSPYDPVLDPATDALLTARPAEERGQGRGEVASGTEGLRGGEWPPAEVVELERELVDAAIEPREPVARPRMPSGRSALPPRLSPSQRGRVMAGE